MNTNKDPQLIRFSRILPDLKILIDRKSNYLYVLVLLLFIYLVECEM